MKSLRLIFYYLMAIGVVIMLAIAAAFSALVVFFGYSAKMFDNLADQFGPDSDAD